MKKLITLFLVLTSLLITSCCSNSSKIKPCENDKFVICQFNMRYAVPKDGKVIKRIAKNKGTKEVLDGSQVWEKRLPLIQDFLVYRDVDICGTQELSWFQVEGFDNMKPEYDYFGTPTYPEKYAQKIPGANNIIIYKTSRFKLLQKGDFWLSETPEKVSNGFGANKPRNCNWGLFRDKKSGKEIYFFNTHIHHIGDETKAKSAELIIQKIREIAGDKPFFLVGDFNMPEDHYGMKPFWNCDFMVDARKVCKTKLYGPNFTNNYGYTGLSTIYYPTTSKTSSPMQWIDWVFVSKSVEVYKCGVMSECIDGVWHSDHFPVILKVSVK